MQQQIQQTEEEENTFIPYAFRGGLGDCADSETAKDVSIFAYAHEISFRMAGMTLVKHAP